MIKNILVVLLMVCVSSLAFAVENVPTKKARSSQEIYGKLLKKYVKDGLVDYRGLRSSRVKQLDRYLAYIARKKPKNIVGRANRFAFWINAYNAITLRAVLDRLPAKKAAQKKFSPLKVKGFWKQFRYEVGGKWYTLNDIEHKVIRVQHKDARLHFALVCAAKGCPKLASRVYRGKGLDRFLAKRTRMYLASTSGLKLDKKTKTVYLSQLFNWYKKDFLWKDKTVLDFVAKYAKKADKEYLLANKSSLKIKYLRYDWKLNVR